MEQFPTTKFPEESDDEKYSAFGRERKQLRETEKDLIKRREEILKKLSPEDREALMSIDSEWGKLKKSKEVFGI